MAFTVDMVLKDLAPAKFRNVPFYVEKSTIKFGQKNIKHSYGESDRTEVEHNGLDDDEFTLELIVAGIEEDYWKARNALKNALSKRTLEPATLIHPFERIEIKCKVVGRVELTETINEIGVARFSVTFQKCQEKIYPVAATDNTAQIDNAMKETMEICEASVTKVKTSSGFVNSYEELSKKLNNIYQVYYDAKKTINMTTAYINTVNSTILGFRSNINKLISLPDQLAKSITGLFNTIAFVATNPIDNITFQKALFGFGSTDEVFSILTAENNEINNNNKIMNNAINANSLAIAFGSMSLISFNTQDELDATRKLLNDQFDSIYEDLDYDTQNALSLLSSLSNSYLDTIDADRVITFNVDLTPLSVAVFNLYGDTDNYEKISKLNRLENDIMADGTIKVIAQD